MTDLLSLPGWRLLEAPLDADGYRLSAEFIAEPDACQRCGVIGRLYRHGTHEKLRLQLLDPRLCRKRHPALRCKLPPPLFDLCEQRVCDGMGIAVGVHASPPVGFVLELVEPLVAQPLRLP